MKRFLVLSASLLMTACTNQMYFTSSDIQYIEDPRTGLCFAMVIDHRSTNKIGMTTVDCNDVEDLLSSDTNASSNPIATATRQPIEKTPVQNISHLYRGKSFSTF